MDPEIIDITELDDIPVISLNYDDDKQKKSSSSYSSRPSVNFGAGIELLMNDKRTSSKKENSDNDDIDLGDLDMLEDELNGLSDIKSTKVTSKSGLFNETLNAMDGKSGIKLNINKEDSGNEDYNKKNVTSLGFSTANNSY